MHVDKHQSSLQVDFNTLSIKVSYKVILSLLLGTIKHSQYTQSIKFPISLQYPQKELRNGVYFLQADKHQGVYKLGLLYFFFDGSGQICPKCQEEDVGNIFSIYFKSVAAAFMFYCDPKCLDILWGSSHFYCYLFPCRVRL